MAYRNTVTRAFTVLLLLPLRCPAARAQDDTPAAGKTASINGMQMYYETHGAGEPLVLLHGFGSAGSQAWGRFIPELATALEFLAPPHGSRP
jgi:hypothetical protein